MNSDKPPKSSLGGSVRRQLKADAESNKAVGEFKVPDSNLLVKRPKRKKVKVLDEEDYADKVSAIIQRDFFPGTSSFLLKLLIFTPFLYKYYVELGNKCNRNNYSLRTFSKQVQY